MRVAVIGVGTIGSGVVADLVLHGIHAVGVDLSTAALDRARDRILEGIRFSPMLAKHLPRLGRKEALERLTLTTQLEEAAACDFVVENIFEEWEAKRALYGRLESVLPPAVCIAANTSCIPISRLAGATKRPDKVVGLHFMNPVPLMATVEVIRGGQTSDATLAAVDRLFALLGKKSIVVGDLAGFVSNRISHLFMNEAVAVLQDGLATPAQIDAIFRECFGHKMGPLETADLIGLDTVARSLDVLFDSFQDPKFRCCPLLRKKVEAGECGVKSGRGFYVYERN